MAQFIPDTLSFGIDDGRVSEREVGAVDMVRIVDLRLTDMI